MLGTQMQLLTDNNANILSATTDHHGSLLICNNKTTVFAIALTLYDNLVNFTHQRLIVNLIYTYLFRQGNSYRSSSGT
jgi:hypothetical protein